MDGWSANATELGPADWSISRNADFWVDGATSLRIDLDNLNGKGAVWIEKGFAVEPRSKYLVTLNYAFSPRNFTDFRTIVSVFRSPTLTADDLSSAYQGDPFLAPLWWPQRYEFTIKSKKTSAIYVFIGVKGTKETRREYFIDSVCVTLTKL